ncbi:MAG TPA: T9SS type B sorting domain-containing protein, partial [Flavobacteriaceae bacterium]|nr:T9SS type B sorting domain-containing protein [Flavobacteriaceae bacterium]
TNFNTIVHRKPELDIEDQVLCLDNLPLIVSAETNVPTDSYLWSNGSTSSYIEVTQIGTYSVTITTQFGCSNSTTFSISESEAATIEFTETVDFSDPNNVTVEVSGIGDYLYQFDDEEPQESNFFYNVPIGPHTITVIDLNGCNSTSKEIVIIDVPKFVTPNNDGYFDNWHITGVEQLEGTIVYIYDRYGKLLKTLSHTSQGWDGTYNGNLLPATDYWYVAHVKNGAIEFEIKGHFTLKL